ncbi:MAG: OsmC family protein [Alicyclobacillus macrosporangiidus]|uniref:OsmC family protein n=1 Tax=Alicyclobacillus macrosporangiidus TaxID=392015 RepID=UPI0026E97174|nr:OsmC family protein [Alicyclobacillus macrosporangiidus]MCL6598295.1 OsmC family protein [Alicyclobacillus macrosporangiidus]
MSEIHTFAVTGRWPADFHQGGTLTAGGLSVSFSIPAGLGGPGIGTNPEELLLASAAGCYLITLGKLLRNRRIPFSEIHLESRGFVENDRGLRFDRIEHRPVVLVDDPADEEHIRILCEHAEHACMVSSALRGNVAVQVVPEVRVQTAPSR